MADKTLNDQIEGVFQGVVFILFSFLSSVFILLVKPKTGFITLVRNLRRRGSNQVRPYVFCFMATALNFFLPTTLDALTPHTHDAFEYQIHDSEHREVGGLGRAYSQATTQIETKVATSVFVATAVGIAVLHLCVTLLGRLALRRKIRRETWRDSAFFVAGLQFVILGVALVVLRQGWPWPISTDLVLLKKFVLSPRGVLEYNEPRFYSVYFDLISVTLLIAVLLTPLAIARRFARHAGLPGQRKFSERSPLRVGAWVLFFLFATDLSALGSFAVAAYVSDEIEPRKGSNAPFAIKQLACTVQTEAEGATVTAEAILAITGTEAWYFEENDFRMFVASKRVAEDGPARSRDPRVLSPNRVSAGPPLKVSKLSAVSPKLGQPPFLLQPGRSVLVSLEVKAPMTFVKFLNDHPDDRRCTVSYTGDYPVGAIGVLNLESGDRVRQYGRR
jgi:hypothetical protein